MPDADDILAQQMILKGHRQTLAHLLQQQALLGMAYTPPGVAAGISEARQQIRRIKQILREWQVEVADLPDDEPFMAPTVAKLPAHPYPAFGAIFRDVIAPYRYAESSAILNIVFGNLAHTQGTTIVIPINQSFDVAQRTSRGVLGSFEGFQLDGQPFFAALEQLWPTAERPRYAGIGETHLLSLPPNPQQFSKLMFVVTTRDLSADPQSYGKYVNTPIAGIDYILDRVIADAVDQQLESIALPLLGTGHANLGVIADDPQHRMLLRLVVLGLTIDTLDTQLRQPNSSIRRGIIVLNSATLNDADEHRLWEFVITYLEATVAERETTRQQLLGQLHA